MKIKIKTHKDYKTEDPKTIVSCNELKKELIFDKEINSKKISNFLFKLLEKNENDKIELIFDFEKHKDDKFLKYIKELFEEFIKSWNDSIDSKFD